MNIIKTNNYNYEESLKKIIANEERIKLQKQEQWKAKTIAKMFKTLKDVQEEKKVTETIVEEIKEEQIVETIEKEQEKVVSKQEYDKMEEYYKDQVDISNELMSKIKEQQIIIERQDRELAEYLPRSDFIEIQLHGFSINEMYDPNPYYYSRKNEKKFNRTDDYNDWEKQFNAALNNITIEKLERTLNLKDINFEQPIRLNIEYGAIKSHDLDNMLKSFQDCLFKYLAQYGYGNDNDNNVSKLILERKIIGTRKRDKSKGYIKFSICNI